MRMITEEKINQIVDKIVKEFHPEKVILFGSYAWGIPTEDSDVDLLIIKDTKNSRDTAHKISHSIFPRPFSMDILVSTPAEIEKKIKEDRNLFIEDVINNGKILYAGK